MRTFHHALVELRSHPFRAALSLVSLCIGVLAVVAIFTVSEISAGVFVASAEQADGRRVTMQGALVDPPAGEQAIEEMLQVGQAFDAAGGASALTMTSTAVTGIQLTDLAARHEPHVQIPLVFTAGRYDAIRRLPVLEGTWIPDDARIAPTVVLNRPAARQWGSAGSSLSISVGRRLSFPALVVGVVADGSPEPMGYVSLYPVATIFPHALTEMSATLLLQHPDAPPAAFDRIGQIAAGRADTSLDANGMQRTDTVDALVASLRTQQKAFLVASALALLIAALGILNIGLATISERSRELVVRRAIGATRSAIVGQMLLSALVLGLVGAAVSVAVAFVGVQWWVPSQIPLESAIDPPSVPWVAVACGVVAAMATTLLGATVPALVASRLDVASVLRE